MYYFTELPIELNTTIFFYLENNSYLHALDLGLNINYLQLIILKFSIYYTKNIINHDIKSIYEDLLSPNKVEKYKKDTLIYLLTNKFIENYDTKIDIILTHDDIELFNIINPHPQSIRDRLIYNNCYNILNHLLKLNIININITIFRKVFLNSTSIPLETTKLILNHNNPSRYELLDILSGVDIFTFVNLESCRYILNFIKYTKEELLHLYKCTNNNELLKVIYEEIDKLSYNDTLSLYKSVRGETYGRLYNLRNDLSIKLKFNLIILDLNGTLILRKNKKVYYRKNLKEFIEYCLSIADVAIYTSMINKNIDLKGIIDKDKLQFIWDRSETIPDPESTNNWDTIKTLDKVFKEYPHYKNVLLIDDSERKVRFLDHSNYIVCKSYENVNEKEDILLKLIEKIKIKLN